MDPSLWYFPPGHFVQLLIAVDVVYTQTSPCRNVVCIGVGDFLIVGVGLRVGIDDIAGWVFVGGRGVAVGGRGVTVGAGVFVGGRGVAVGARLQSLVVVLHPYVHVSVAPHCRLVQLCDFVLLSIHRRSDPLHSSGTHSGESSHTVFSVHDTVRYVFGTFVPGQPPVPQLPVLSNATLQTFGVAVAFGAELHTPFEQP